MLSINKIMNIYPYEYYINMGNKKVSEDCPENINAKIRETITTWRFDEEGNIVYYTLDKKTGEIISKTKYKNPNKINFHKM